MLIPYGTDAPIYYFPYATIGLIVANVAIFFATVSYVQTPVDEFEMPDGTIVVSNETNDAGWLLLEYDKIHPLQWVTSNFMHADILHVVGNMIFLWGFGLIIEGKLGWWRFLLLYLAVGVISCAIEQTLCFLTIGMGSSLGASGIIFGMMAIAMVWAPQNELNCLLFIRFVPRSIELSVIAFAGFKIAFEVFYLVLDGFAVSSAMLHLLGGLVGLPLAVLYVKKRWVDCEGWDAMTVYFSSTEQQDKTRSEFRDRNRVAAFKEEKEQRDQEVQTKIESLASALQSKQNLAAIRMFARFEGDLQGGAKLPPKLLPALISAMHEQKEWAKSIPLLVLLLKKLPKEKSIRPRLKLAQILIKMTEQPKQGLIVLSKLPSKLPEKEATLRRKLAKAAKQALAEGSFEIETHDDW